MNRISFFFSLLALNPFHPHAGSCDAGESRNTIRVVGEATVAVMPNYAVINLEVITRNKNLAQAKLDHQNRVEKVIAAAKSFVLEMKYITTLTAKIDKQFLEAEGADAKKTSAERFIGYDMSQKIVVYLYELSNYKTLLDKIVSNAFVSLKDVDFRHTENRKYQDQARVAAVKAAREKAVLIAGAVEQKIGRALKIDENPDWNSWSGNPSISGASGLENQYIIGGIEVTTGPETVYPVAGLITFREKICTAFELQ